MVKQSMNTHLTREEIIKSGSVYTSPELVNLVYGQVRSYIDKNTVIGDFGSGYGAFIEKFKNEGKRCFGTEFDDLSFELLNNEYPNIDIYHENSLLNVNREKYNLLENDKLIVVGNPPYNDTTSIFKKGEKGELICDSDITSRDFGISFLKAYNKLKAEYVCILHPLAYLIKKQNFNSLGDFKNNYRLIRAVIFSSQCFESIIKTNAEFPVVAALYERNAIGMNHLFIDSFEFEIYNSNKKFSLWNISTIDKKVNKYPKRDEHKGLQFYTLRDINALMRNASFIEGNIANGVEVPIDSLYQYGWLLFFKMNFKPINNGFLYGNLSPLYPNNISNEFKNAAAFYAYHNNSLVSKFYSKEMIESEYGVEIKNNVLSKALDSMYLF